MFDVLNEVNWFAFLIGTIVYFVLGALWFTPLFGKQYDKATGVDRSKNQKWPMMYYVGPFVGALLSSGATALLVAALGVANVGDAVILGLIVGIGYSGAVSLTNAIAPNMPKPLLFAAITGSYHLVGVTLVAVICILMA